jgi:post-segregation antitoxin (ccd killing protein)
MSGKVKVNLTINRKVVEKAKKIGLNLSQFCENALKEAIEALEQRKTGTETNGGLVDARSASHQQPWWTGRDLNPRPPECKSGVHARLNYRPTLNYALFD